MCNYSERFIHIDEIEKSISSRKQSISALNKIASEIELIQDTKERDVMENLYKNVPNNQNKELNRLYKALNIAKKSDFPKGIWESDYLSLSL